MSILLLSLLVPPGLLLLMLVMERIEQLLQVDSVTEQLGTLLTTARHPDELETFVSDVYGPALERYWRRHRRSRSLFWRPRAVLFVKLRVLADKARLGHI